MTPGLIKYEFLITQAIEPTAKFNNIQRFTTQMNLNELVINSIKLDVLKIKRPAIKFNKIWSCITQTNQQSNLIYVVVQISNKVAAWCNKF